MDEKIKACYGAGLLNGWASGRYAIAEGDFISSEDCLNEKSISEVKSVLELKKHLSLGYQLGQGFIFKDLFFLQQIDGGDEWATYKIVFNIKENKYIVRQFESMTFEAKKKSLIEFSKLIMGMSKSSLEDCLKLQY